MTPWAMLWSWMSPGSRTAVVEHQTVQARVEK